MYKRQLIDSGRHDVQCLTVQFGKTEAYIRTRLKFVSLIPEIAVLLEQDEITISVASEICRYGEEIQREDVYKRQNGRRAGGDGFVRKLEEVLGSFVRSIQK